MSFDSAYFMTFFDNLQEPIFLNTRSGEQPDERHQPKSNDTTGVQWLICINIFHGVILGQLVEVQVIKDFR